VRTSSFLAIHNHRLRRFVGVSVAAVGAALLIVSCSNAPSVPKPLESMGRYSENLYDAARANDWTAAVAQLDTLKRAATDLSTIGNTSTELKADVNAQLAVIDTSVSNRNRAATLRAANEVTRLAAELARPYKPSVPVEITLLDYSGRELELWAEVGDLAKLDAATTAMRQTWNAVRKTVEGRPNGVAVAASFEALVSRADAATTVSDYAAVATPILDEVDKLEGVFTKPIAPG